MKRWEKQQLYRRSSDNATEGMINKGKKWRHMGAIFKPELLLTVRVSLVVQTLVSASCVIFSSLNV